MHVWVDACVGGCELSLNLPIDHCLSAACNEY